MADIQYPRWRYHATKPDTLVQDAKEERALGAGWVDNPAQARPSKDEPTPQQQIDAAKVAEQKAAEAEVKAKADRAKAEAEAKAKADAEAKARADAAAKGPVPVK